MIFIEVGGIALAFCVILLIVIKIGELILRHFYIRRLIKECSKVEQYHLYGWVDKLTKFDEMYIWVDPVILRQNHPILTERNINKILGFIEKQDFKDLLYVRSQLAIVIRIPKGCTVTFGQGCFSYKNYPSQVVDSDNILKAFAFKSQVLSNEAKLIKTVRHIS